MKQVRRVESVYSKILRNKYWENSLQWASSITILHSVFVLTVHAEDICAKFIPGNRQEWSHFPFTRRIILKRLHLKILSSDHRHRTKIMGQALILFQHIQKITLQKNLSWIQSSYHKIYSRQVDHSVVSQHTAQDSQDTKHRSSNQLNRSEDRFFMDSLLLEIPIIEKTSLPNKANQLILWKQMVIWN